jgi:hypothetical protein
MTIGLGLVWAAAPAVAGDHKPPVIQCGTPTPPPHCDPPLHCGTTPPNDPPAPATPVVRDHRQPKPGPVVRDHRQPAERPIVRDHRTTQQGPIVRDHRTNQGPIVRDHRTPTYTVPTNRPPVVNTPPVKSPYPDPKWHGPKRPNTSNAPGGVVVTQSPVVNRPYNSQQNSMKRPRRPSSGSSLPIPKLPIVVRLPF